MKPPFIYNLFAVISHAPLLAVKYNLPLVRPNNSPTGKILK